MCKRRTKRGLYTSLNKTPRKPTTLFHIDQQWLNEYQGEIRTFAWVFLKTFDKIESISIEEFLYNCTINK